jgi:hypothetical protein
MSKKKKQKGLSDAKLVEKYEKGKINLKKALKPALKPQKESA